MLLCACCVLVIVDIYGGWLCMAFVCSFGYLFGLVCVALFCVVVGRVCVLVSGVFVRLIVWFALVC